jgi:hypothetical protein
VAGDTDAYRMLYNALQAFDAQLPQSGVASTNSGKGS